MAWFDPGTRRLVEGPEAVAAIWKIRVGYQICQATSHTDCGTFRPHRSDVFVLGDVS